MVSNMTAPQPMPANHGTLMRYGPGHGPVPSSPPGSWVLEGELCGQTQSRMEPIPSPNRLESGTCRPRAAALGPAERSASVAGHPASTWQSHLGKLNPIPCQLALGYSLRPKGMRYRGSSGVPDFRNRRSQKARALFKTLNVWHFWRSGAVWVSHFQQFCTGSLPTTCC